MSRPSFNVLRATILTIGVALPAFLTQQAASKPPTKTKSTSSSKLSSKPKPRPKPRDKETHTIPEKPPQIPHEYRFLKREVKGNKVVEHYEVTKYEHVWNGKTWEKKPTKTIESITKPLGGTLPAQPGATGTAAGGPSTSSGGGSLTPSGGGSLNSAERSGASPSAFSLSPGFGPSETNAFVAKYLRIENQTGEKLTVHVQFEALNENNKWTWLPVHPAAKVKRDLRYTYAPDEVAVLEDDTGRIRARRVRIWARTESGKEKSEFKSKDRWLVEEDGAGQHRYFSTAMQTANIVID